MHSIFNTSSKPFTKDLLVIPEEAVSIHEKIVSILEQMELADNKSCLDQEFKFRYFKMLELYEQYQNVVVKNSQYKINCKRGCSYCCYHWVEDVTSFEAEIIAEYLKKYFPDKISAIIDQCQEDLEVLKHIEELTYERIDSPDIKDSIDSTDLVLSVFYQMKKMCPLLSEHGTCSIYKVRPLTCRIYVSFSDSIYCNPEYQDQENITTYLLNLEESASAILDKLHFRYQKFPNDTGLRSLLLKYLGNNS